MFTFRAMAERAGLNPYQYVHVNLREQCSWVHTGDKAGATAKGINIVRAGVAKCALTHPLTAIRIETQPRVLVVGAGVAGMRAALSLAEWDCRSSSSSARASLGAGRRKSGGWAPTISTAPRSLRTCWSRFGNTRTSFSIPMPN